MDTPQNSSASSAGAVRPDRVVELCRDLIRIPSVNTGNNDGPGERAAAEYVAAVLTDLKADPLLVESAPGRANVLARVEGTDRSRPPLLVHGHLDVVPADPADWTYPPFAGEIVDGYLWGRGAVDMKNMDAMILASLERLQAAGERPARDLVLAFTADEEAGSDYGAHWLAEQHREFLEPCTEAIGEVGGFSITVNEQRMYLIETAEKGLAWMRLLADGTAGHGSMRNHDNAVVHLAEAISRIGSHDWPVSITPSVEAFLAEAAELTGLPFESSGDQAPAQADAIIASLGAIGALLHPMLRNNANPTMLDAGYKMNVVPGHAMGGVDGRVLPGQHDAFLDTIDGLLGPHVRREMVQDADAVETTFDGAFVEAMIASLQAHDPGARVAPYLMFGGTDAKAFHGLDIRCFGFAPLRLPPELDFAALFHGVDERVPTTSLGFGVDVLTDFLRTC